MTSRRNFFTGAAALVGAGLVSRAGAATLPEAPIMNSAATQPPPPPPNGRPYNPVVTLNGWSLPWRMNKGVKEFHLIAEPVVREIAPGMKANLWGYNGQSPGPTIEVVEGDRVRIRAGNLTMTNHPIHLHGHEFEVTGTDGGWTRPESRWPEVTTDIAVGQMRAIEFIADAPGDWPFHCHKSHHTMNAMGHDVPNLIGVDHRGVAEKISKLVPDYMVMGDKGGSMGDMEMPLPENTLPMMTGQGPFGGIEMGGMFTVLKVRRDQKRGDYGDPGWYKHPAGTVAYEWKGEAPAAVRSHDHGGQAMPAKHAREVEMTVRKPVDHHGKH